MQQPPGVHSPTRPTLLSASAAADAQGSILASLEGERKRPGVLQRNASGKRMWWGAFVVLIACALIWGTSKNNRLASWPKVAQAERKADLADATESTETLPPAAASPAAEAAVIHEAPESSLTPTPPLAAVSPDTLQPSPGMLLDALEGNGAGRPSPQASRSTSTGNNRPAAKPSAGDARGQSRQPAKIDSDVALLTELVAAVKLSEAPVTPAPGASDKLPNRDIVERMPGDSTESLLARCRKLGFLEGELCRWRICSGQHSDPACRAS